MSARYVFAYFSAFTNRDNTQVAPRTGQARAKKAPTPYRSKKINPIANTDGMNSGATCAEESDPSPVGMRADLVDKTDLEPLGVAAAGIMQRPEERGPAGAASASLPTPPRRSLDTCGWLLGAQVPQSLGRAVVW